MKRTKDEQRGYGVFNPRGTQEKPPQSLTKYSQKGHSIALPEQTDSKNAEQNTNITPTKNGLFLVGKLSYKARMKLENSGFCAIGFRTPARQGYGKVLLSLH